jgi:HSP20 family molecular chaperone IbpA
MTEWNEESLSDIERRMLRNPKRSPRTFDGSVFAEMGHLMADALYGGLDPEDEALGSRAKECFSVEPGGKTDPLVEVSEDGDAIHILAEAPGVAEDEIELRDLGERVEIRCGSLWRRSFRIPGKFSLQKATKRLKNGVLEIVIPRTGCLGGGF